jgi:hypothetical protein
VEGVFSEVRLYSVLRRSHGLGPPLAGVPGLYPLPNPTVAGVSLCVLCGTGVPVRAKRAPIAIRMGYLIRALPLYTAIDLPLGDGRPGRSPKRRLGGEGGGRGLDLRLPPGYSVHHDPDVLVLRRADGSVVARFSGRGLDPEQVERAAREDHGDATPEGPSASRVPSKKRRRSASRSRSVPRPPRQP